MPVPRSFFLQYRRAIQDVAWLSVASVAVKPLWLVFITVLCARVLGAQAYGELTTALSLGALAFALSNLGLVQYTVREVAGNRSLASRFLTNFLSLRVGLFLPAAAIALVAGYVLGYPRALMMGVGLACVYYAAQSILEYAHALFQASEKLRYQALSVIIEKVLVVGAGGVLLYATASPSLTLLGMAAGMAVAAIVTVWWVTREVATIKREELSLPFLLESLHTLVPFAVAGLFGMMYFRVDTIVVEAMLGTVSAGQYGLAFRLVEAMNLLPFILVHASLYPRLSHLSKQGDFVEFQKLMRYGAALLALISVLLAAAMFVMAEPLIGWIVSDPELDPAGPTLSLLCWVFPFTCLRVLVYTALLALHQQRFIAGTLAAAVALNVTLNVLLLPVLGIRGAALATIVSEILLMLVYAVRYRARLHIEAKKEIPSYPES